MRYNPYCLCAQCQAYTLITLGQSALAPQEFVRRARRYTLTNEQQKIVDEVKLKLWNMSVKGEQAS
jgi:hypothetical protein